MHHNLTAHTLTQAIIGACERIDAIFELLEALSEECVSRHGLALYLKQALALA